MFMNENTHAASYDQELLLLLLSQFSLTHPFLHAYTRKLMRNFCTRRQ